MVFYVIDFSDYADSDIGVDDLCIGEPYNDKVLARMQSIHGGPLICLSEKGYPVLSGIASRNSKSIQNGSPGIFTDIFVLRRVPKASFAWVEFTLIYLYPSETAKKPNRNCNVPVE